MKWKIYLLYPHNVEFWDLNLHKFVWGVCMCVCGVCVCMHVCAHTHAHAGDECFLGPLDMF